VAEDLNRVESRSLDEVVGRFRESTANG